MSNLTARLDPPYLYCLIDTSYAIENLPNIVREALAGGVKLFQLRAKDSDEEALIRLAKDIKKQLDFVASDNLLIINDNPHICKLIDADGVHLGADDMSPQSARELLGGNAIIGATIHNIEEAESMAYNFVDYVGIGPVFASPTKKNLTPLSPQDLRDLIASIRRHSRHDGRNDGRNECPIICIGGIEQNNMQLLKDYKIDGIALAAAISNPATTTSVCKTILAELKSW